jgi:hypothetical protein
MEELFGPETIRKKVRKKKKDGEWAIFIDISPCKLRGIDLKAIIKEHAKGGLQ